MQMSLHIANKEEMKLAYAFAVSPVRRKPSSRSLSNPLTADQASWPLGQEGLKGSLRGKRQSLRARNQAIITACSKEAKRFGIRAGMRYEEAKQLMPEMRILIYGRS